MFLFYMEMVLHEKSHQNPDVITRWYEAALHKNTYIYIGKMFSYQFETEVDKMELLFVCWIKNIT